jgi:segregation and condensation protein B
MNLKKNIEALLYISNKPLSIKELAGFCSVGKAEIETVLETLKKEYNESERGIKIVTNAGKIQFATDSDCSEIVEKFLKAELTGEMTRPQLETLTIVAYRGPISKAELEQIRGVNCSLILRNLKIRGLVDSSVDRKTSENMYFITIDFVKNLGLENIEQLPEYEKLSQHETLEEMLNK